MIHSISCIKESIKPLPRVINDNPIKNKYDRISNPRELLIPDHGRSSDLLHLMTPFPFMQKTVAWVSSSDFVWSLQQRVCSGFTPDSLFTTRHESDGWHHNQWQRYILLLKLTFLQIFFIRNISETSYEDTHKVRSDEEMRKAIEDHHKNGNCRS